MHWPLLTLSATAWKLIVVPSALLYLAARVAFLVRRAWRRSDATLKGMIGMAQAVQPVPPACPGKASPACACDGSCSGTLPVTTCLCPACVNAAIAQFPVMKARPARPGGGGNTPGSSGGAGGVSAGGKGGGVSAGGKGGGGGNTSGSSGGAGGVSAGGGGGSAYSAGGIVSGTFSGLTGFSPAVTASVTGRPAGRAGRASHAGIPGFDGTGQGDYALAIGCVRGLRQWRLPIDAYLHAVMASERPPAIEELWPSGGNAPLLTGVTGRSWSPGINEARCNNYSEHVPPVEWDDARKAECGCGFWAYWSIADRSWHDKLPVFGVVEGTGRVLIGTKGFRCQQARIVALVPAFTIEVSVASIRSAQAGSGLWSDLSSFPFAAPELSPEEAALRDRELREAQDRAQAWMGVIMELLGRLYPEARVFATLKGMLASVPLGEVTE